MYNGPEEYMHSAFLNWFLVFLVKAPAAMLLVPSRQVAIVSSTKGYISANPSSSSCCMADSCIGLVGLEAGLLGVEDMSVSKGEIDIDTAASGSIIIVLQG